MKNKVHPKNQNFILSLLLFLMVSLPIVLWSLNSSKDTRDRAATSSCATINSYVNPATVTLGAGITLAMTSNQGFTSLVIDPGSGLSCATYDGHSCSGNPLDSNSCWWRWFCTATKVGSYSFSFNNAQSCSKTVGYTVTASGVTVSPTPQVYPTGINSRGLGAYVSPQPVAVGQTISFIFTASYGYTYLTLDPQAGATGCVYKTIATTNPMNDGNKSWWKWNCTAAKEGTYTVTFGNAENISWSVSYTVGNVATATPIPMLTLTPSPTPIVSSTPTLTPTPTQTLTPSPTSSGTTYLNFKMEYGGVRQPADCAIDWPVTVTVMGVGESRIFSNIIPSKISDSSDGNVYKVSVDVSSMAIKNNLAVFVKGLKHIQVKYGKNNQSDFYTLPGGELTASATTISDVVYDFSNYPLTPGDITSDGSNTTQDGIISGLDFSYLKSKSLVHESTGSGNNLMADLDGNCQVNTRDVDLLRKALDTKQSQLY